MAMFTAYFDASGNPNDQPFVIVSGYIANSFQWRMFEQTWASMHADHRVNLPFHMVEFQAATSNIERYSKQRNAREDYVNLAKDRNKANEFFKKICIAQLTMINCAVSCVVRMAVYNNVSSLLNLREVVPPYALAARTCMERIHKWEQEFEIEERVECVFEAGDFEQGKFTDLMIDEGMAPPIYKNKEDFAGLQAVDQYCWEELFYLKKELQNQNLEPRKSLKLLLNGIPKLHIEPTTISLIKLCEAKGIDPRTGIKRGE